MDKVSGSGGKKKPGRTSRDEWLAGAFKEIVERGVKGFSVERLADRLGVSKGGFYWHFKTREDILFAALAHWEHIVVEGFWQAMAARGYSGSESLEKGIRFSIDQPESAPGGAIEMSFHEWARSDPRVKGRVYDVFRNRLRTCARSYEEMGLDQGAAASRAAGFIAYLTGLAVYAYMLSDDEKETLFRQGVNLWTLPESRRD